MKESSFWLSPLTLLFDGKALGHMKVVSLAVQREVNAIPSATVTLEPVDETPAALWEKLSEDLGICPSGKNVHIVIGGDGEGATLFDGIVVAQHLRWDSRRPVLDLTLKHRLHLLAGAPSYQVHQDKSDSDVISALFKKHRVTVGSVANIGAMSDKHPQLVQWASSDWQWLRSRMHAHDVWLIPRMSGVDCITPKLAATADHTIDAIRADERSVEVQEGEWHFDGSARLKGIDVDYWDEAKQCMSDAHAGKIPVLGQGGLDPAKTPPLDQDVWHIRHAMSLTAAEASSQANARMLTQQAAVVKGRFSVYGSPESIRYELGQTLALKGFGSHLSGHGIISEIRHKWSRGQFITTIAIGQEALRSVDAGLLPSAPGLTVATIDSYDSEKEKYRVKVLVPLLGKTPIWARLGQPYASKHSGFAFYPDKGDEIVLAFLDEDPRYPVVLGSTHIEAARALYRIERAARLPHMDMHAGGVRQRQPASVSPVGISTTANTYQVDWGLAAFELDVFGRVRNLSAAALDEYWATNATANMVRISLIAEVSRAYIGLLAAHEAAQITSEVTANRLAIYDLTRVRYEGGTITQSEFDEIRAQYYGAKVELERVQRVLSRSTHALVLLLGRALPAGIDAKRSVDTVVFEAVPPGLSSRLIARRPDIIAAEYRLRARHAHIGAARAAFFPRLTLTGALGVTSADLSDLFTGAARMWRFAPQLVLPIFNGGENRANLDIAMVRKEAAVAAYERTIQLAFAEVADALTDSATLTREYQAQAMQVASVDLAAMSSQRRYEAGVEDYARYLDVQRRALDGRLALTETRREMAIARIALYRALGGGWQLGLGELVDTALSMVDGAKSI